MAKGKDIRDLKGIKICCIGPATAQQIHNRGIRVDLVPAKFISEGILKSFSRKKIEREEDTHRQSIQGARCFARWFEKTRRGGRCCHELTLLLLQKKRKAI